MVNRYDTPAQAEFINTYVPIPFEQLYTLGKQAKENVDETMSQFTGALNEWDDFQSLSTKDTKAFYDETYGRSMPIAEELAQNIDLIKTPEGRAKIFSVINNTDRAKLSMLRQSAEGLKERQKVNQRLMLEGKYNPLWHDVNFTEYDTIGAGKAFDEVSPLAYKDIREIANPYFKELQPGYIETKGNYDYFGNTKEDVEAVANANFNDIVNTPEAIKHMQVFMQTNPGATAQDAQAWFKKQIVDSNLDRTIRPTAKVNEFALMDYKQSFAEKIAKIKKGEQEQQQPAPDAYAQVYTSNDIALKNKLLNNPVFANAMQADARAKQVYDEITNEIAIAWEPALKNGQITKTQFDNQMRRYEEQLKQAPNVGDEIKRGLRGMFFNFSGGINPTKKIATDKIVDYARGASKILDEVTVPASPLVDNAYLRNSSNREVVINENNVEMTGFVAPNSNGVMLALDYANKLMGVPNKNLGVNVTDNSEMQRNFLEDVKSGEFKGIIKVPQYSHTVDNVNGSNSIVQRISIKIPKSAILNANYNYDSFKAMAATYFNVTPVSNLNIEIPGTSKTAKQPSTFTDEYFTFDAVQTIPNTGFDRMVLDQAIDKEFGGAGLQKENNPSNIDQSFENMIDLVNFAQ